MTGFKDITVLIPARYASSRFPGKPLAPIQDRPMILHVLDQAQALGTAAVYVATDDERIAQCVENEGYKVVMTSNTHICGTDRLAEAISILRIKTPYVLNIQGDEPLLPPDLPMALQSLLDRSPEIGTLVSPISSTEDLGNSSVVKAVLTAQKKVLYFSRAAVPFIRDQGATKSTSARIHYRHLGIYLFKREVLMDLAKLKPSSLEQAEKLEQLRWMEHGFQVQAAVVKEHVQGVDTPQDLERVNKIFTERSKRFFP